jgi:AAA+ superfamily predicted ATPase
LKPTAKFQNTLDDVVLDQDVLTKITNLVKVSRLMPDAASEALLAQIRTAGALLYGPPGTGKTHLARAVASSVGSKYLMIIDAATINNKYIGEAEKTIAAVFSLAKKLFPCIIFLDEVDALFYRRSEQDRSWERANITQFLQSMDGILQEEKSPFILAATNRPMDLDTAFLRRLPHKIAFDMPDLSARARILSLFLKEDDLRGVDVDNIATATAGFSGSDLKTLCGQAALLWASEQKLDGEGSSKMPKVLLTNEHFIEALRRSRPTVSQSDLFEMQRFRQRYDSITTKTSIPGNPSSGVDTTPHDITSTKHMQALEVQKTQGRELLEVEKQAELTRLKINEQVPAFEPEDGKLVNSDKDAAPIMPIINPPEDYMQHTRLQYRYTALPSSTSVRLLKVLTTENGAKHTRGGVDCSMVTVDLEDNPDYFALSYTWGDPRTLYLEKADMFPSQAWAAPAFDIKCDGQTVSVATNLYTALISITASLGAGTYAQKLGKRYKAQDATFFYIWIDALCIHQDNLQEKSSQIPLMGRIYSQARCTLMWLGGSELLLSQGWAATQECLGVIVDNKGTTGDRSAKVQSEELLDLTECQSYTALGLKPLTRRQLLGWYLLLSRSWFKRAWVMQEWILSQNATFICGDMLIEPLEFIFRVADFQSRGWISQMQHLVIGNLWEPQETRIPKFSRKAEIVVPQTLLPLSIEREHADIPWIYRAELDYDIHDDLDTAHLSAHLLRRMVNEEDQWTPHKVRTQSVTISCKKNRTHGILSLCLLSAPFSTSLSQNSGGFDRLTLAIKSTPSTIFFETGTELLSSRILTTPSRSEMFTLRQLQPWSRT